MTDSGFKITKKDPNKQYSNLTGITVGTYEETQVIYGEGCMTNTPDFPALVELASRLEGKDKKTCELALYTLKKQDERIDKRNARIAALEAALKPFARAYEMGNKWSAGPNRGDLREAYKAIGGEGWQFRTSSGENKELDIMDHMYLIGVEWGEKKARAAMEGK